MSSRSLDDLHPFVKKLAQDFITVCAAKGIDILITSTYRSNEEQAALYAQGRTIDGHFTPGDIVTKAKPGQSYHNWRVAFDFAPIVNGKAQWKNLALFKKCGEIAESVGLEWAGRWKNNPESAHCQYTGGLTLADFQNGKKLA